MLFRSALTSALSGYQPKGDYATVAALANYQPKGDYASVAALSGYQPKGNYALATALSEYQTKGNYATVDNVQKNTMWCADGSKVCMIPTEKQIPANTVYYDDGTKTGKTISEILLDLANRIKKLEGKK